jgi:hypothetical protein
MEGAGGGNPDLERRATVRLVHYWNSICRNNAMPAFVDFDPHRNPIDWDHCLLASCAGPKDVVLEHVGAALADLDAKAEKACPPGVPPHGLVTRILAPLPRIVGGATPGHHDDIFALPGVGRVLFRSVLLPFRSVDAARHYILGAATFRIDPLAAMDQSGRVDAPEMPERGDGRRPSAQGGP